MIKTQRREIVKTVRPYKGIEVIGKTIALIQIPNQRLFGVKAAARYLGISDDSLRKYTALGQVRAYDFNGKRAYRLEDLDAWIESLQPWTGEGSG